MELPSCIESEANEATCGFTYYVIAINTAANDTSSAGACRMRVIFTTPRRLYSCKSSSSLRAEVLRAACSPSCSSVTMSSVRLQGLSSRGQFDQIKDHLVSSTAANFVQSFGIAFRTEVDLEATLTLRDSVERTKALTILLKFLSAKYPEVHADYAFLGITVLGCSQSSQGDTAIEFVLSETP